MNDREETRHNMKIAKGARRLTEPCIVCGKQLGRHLIKEANECKRQMGNHIENPETKLRRMTPKEIQDSKQMKL